MHRVLVSAHRGGVGAERQLENTVAGIERAVRSSCDYVEFDVRRFADGRIVLHHDPQLLVNGTAHSIARTRSDALAGRYEPLDLDGVLALLRGRKRAHVDLKLDGDEVDVVRQVVEALGVDNVIVTTAEDRAVRELRAWSSEHAPGLLVGLSSSPRVGHGGDRSSTRTRVESWLLRRRLRRSDANLVVSHRRLVRLGLRRYARRRGLPLLVWTVDDPRQLRRFMNDPDVWMVVTNFPFRAAAARMPSPPRRT